MIDNARRPSRLSGLWACLVGGAGITLLLVFLQPVTNAEGCPNAGAAGNASAFANPAWDTYLVLVVLGWLALVIVEQLLPITWRYRAERGYWIRAAAALGLSVTASCCLFLPLELVCH